MIEFDWLHVTHIHMRQLKCFCCSVDTWRGSASVVPCVGAISCVVESGCVVIGMTSTGMYYRVSYPSVLYERVRPTTSLSY